MEPWIHLDQPAPLTDIEPWDGNIDPFTHYVGYSVLGHVIVHAATTGEYGILYPLQQGFKNYGAMSWDDFRRSVLDDPDFRAYAIPRSHVEAIAAHAGPLEPGEVYIPVPYPFLGGSGEPETYSRGDHRVFLAIVGQFHGLESRA